MKVITIIILCLLLFGCSSLQSTENKIYVEPCNFTPNNIETYRELLQSYIDLANAFNNCSQKVDLINKIYKK